jgi:hypothetical protein
MMEDQRASIFLRHMSHVFSHIWLVAILIQGGTLKGDLGQTRFPEFVDVSIGVYRFS